MIARRNDGQDILAVVVKYMSLTSDIEEKSAGASPFDFVPQLADMLVDDVGLRHKVEFPYILEQHLPRHQPASVRHEIFEQLELACRQLYRIRPVAAALRISASDKTL
ncbi:hypothetical protein [Methylocapsa aurea]|uniref:hypothetical protein n=1 Tax=Methylocapsa aurea TaxID=663610 RepID=UPI003D18B403